MTFFGDHLTLTFLPVSLSQTELGFHPHKGLPLSSTRPPGLSTPCARVWEHSPDAREHRRLPLQVLQWRGRPQLSRCKFSICPSKFRAGHVASERSLQSDSKSMWAGTAVRPPQTPLGWIVMSAQDEAFVTRLVEPFKGSPADCSWKERRRFGMALRRACEVLRLLRSDAAPRAAAESRAVPPREPCPLGGEGTVDTSEGGLLADAE
ncbi:unnamed protein product [Rangifer tarandus platyrhynchus]|uniref:Uncharacterized protein n=2 Tax=Rangifer tarandus platyrhynchus TaxID=3082113 RepID=A0ACB0E6J4_RANTA|nr:unnamed protein product [Rangifer tarandus platyrhynchus]CAI9695928.1 unnamed protein product [Rangifer tarandus platyrhynchus]